MWKIVKDGEEDIIYAVDYNHKKERLVSLILLPVMHSVTEQVMGCLWFEFFIMSVDPDCLRKKFATSENGELSIRTLKACL